MDAEGATASRWRLRATAGLTLSALLLATAPGCSSGPSRPRPDEWPFAPATLRVHPLTRVVLPRVNTRSAVPPNTTLIEAHIELLDIDGFDTRGLGELLLELDSRGDSSLKSLSWVVDLNDLARNRLYFDGVTQTYRVPLEIAWPTAPRNGIAVLRASLETPTGRRIASSGEIRWPAVPPPDLGLPPMPPLPPSPASEDPPPPTEE